MLPVPAAARSRRLPAQAQRRATTHPAGQVDATPARAQPGAQGHVTPATAGRRRPAAAGPAANVYDLKGLDARVAEAGGELTKWRALLQEAAAKLGGPCKHLLKLYQQATDAIDMDKNRKSFEYAQLWIEFARLRR